MAKAIREERRKLPGHPYGILVLLGLSVVILARAWQLRSSDSWEILVLGLGAIVFCACAIMFIARDLWRGVQTLRRSHRLRHNLCLGCGYPLKGLPSLTCPECGREFADPEVRGETA